MKYTKDQAIKKFKLDRRVKWVVFCGNLCRTRKFTTPCSGCEGGGCDECGYQGKRISLFPEPAINPDTGNPILIKGENFS